MEIFLGEGERLEDLQCAGLKIIQNKNYYTFTSDSVLLANFVNLKAKDVCVEIGAGCGVISILMSAKTQFKKIYAFEIQEELAGLAQKNVKLNNLEQKIEIICENIVNFDKFLEKGSIDCVISNPPYMKSEGKNFNEIRNIARHDNYLPIDKLCKTTSLILREGGKFYIVYSAERSCELIYQLIKNKLEPKKMFFTQNGKGDVKLVLIEAVKGGKHSVKVLPELVTNDEKGDYLEKLHTKYIK